MTAVGTSMSAVIVCARFGTLHRDGLGHGRAVRRGTRSGRACRASSRPRVQDREQRTVVERAARRCGAPPPTTGRSSPRGVPVPAAARSFVSDGSSATWYSSHTSSSNGASGSSPSSYIAPAGGTSPPSNPGGRSPREPSISKYCVSWRLGRVGVVRARTAKLVPSTCDCATPSIRGGRFDADELEDGRQHVDRVRELAADRRRRGRSRIDAGSDTMHGSATPPSCTSRFQRLNGVLPAIVQPHG